MHNSGDQDSAPTTAARGTRPTARRANPGADLAAATVTAVSGAAAVLALALGYALGDTARLLARGLR